MIQDSDEFWADEHETFITQHGRPKRVEPALRIAQHTQAKMPSWGEVTNGITFSTVGERDVAAEVFSRIARHFGCA